MPREELAGIRRIATVGAVIAAVVGLAAAIASAVDDLGPTAAFCAEAGCATVRQSAWAHPLGIPMSVLGVAFFATMVVLCFAKPTPRVRRLRLALALVGAAWAIWLIVLQAFVIGAWCKLCLIADPSAIALAACILLGAGTLSLQWPRMVGLVVAVAVVVLVLGTWTKGPALPPSVERPSELPEFVQRAQAPRGVTIVEFVDFECPFCRQAQKRLDEAIARANVEVTFVRKMMPLPAHAGAVPAALAWACADKQGKGDAMARALFEALPMELTVGGCLRIAEEVGLNLEQYRADVVTMTDRIRADLADAETARIEALPTMFIGDLRVNGASLSVDELVQILESQTKK